MKQNRKFSLILAGAFMISLAGCGQQSSTQATGNTNTSQESKSEEIAVDQTGEKTLVAYFAYSENMGDTGNMDVTRLLLPA